MATRLIAILSCLLALRAPADSVTLLSRATLDPSCDVTLSDVAVLDGPAAIAMSDLVVLPAAQIDTTSPWFTVDIQRLRDAISPLDAHTRAVLNISGRACVVRVRAVNDEDVSEQSSHPIRALDPARANVRAHVEAALVNYFQVPASELRLEFEDRDADLLNLKTDDRAVHARIAGLSSRIPVVVTVYDGQTIAASGTVRITTHVLREVAVAASPIRRAETITPDMLRNEQRWLPADAEPCSAESLIGAVARRSIDADQAIDASAAQPPIAIHRGDVVVVHCVLGSIVIEERARARHAARDGEPLELESLDGAKRRFLARAAGPGRAVLIEGPIGPERHS
ncbi:MAG: flagellar basal body P-ring formation protein FlgA [Phycisphaeraceae bacterium]|nr:flagellar basal body P-ring formation protein FlgA [Phycisphaeraceae bacterium]